MVEKPDEECITTTHVEEERSVLGSLRGQGKHQKVGSIRIGGAKKSDQPGALTSTTAVGAHQGGAEFAIFQVTA